tara:strand:+ start:583 stop:1245 length:663 start_codon:yes stop_codon:yes gene_type:complete
MSEFEQYYEYLVPLLQFSDDDGNYLYNPETFMELYGAYFNPLNTELLDDVSRESAILQDTLYSNAYQNLRLAEQALGTSGAINTDVYQNMLNEVTDQLYTGSMSAAQAKANALRSIREGFYDDVSFLTDEFVTATSNPEGSSILQYGQTPGESTMGEFGQYLDLDLYEDLPYNYNPDYSIQDYMMDTGSLIHMPTPSEGMTYCYDEVSGSFDLIPEEQCV